MNIHDNGILQAKWRVGVGVGNAVGRGVFAQLGEYPNGEDVFIGIMDEARDAKHIVEVHNASLGRTRAPLSESQWALLDQLTGKDPDGLRKVVVDFLTAVTKLPGLSDAPDSRLIAELRNQIPPPPRCKAEEGATGIQCYRTDEHDIHDGYWEQAKVYLRWPAPDPRTAPQLDDKPMARCNKCRRYTDKIEEFGELCGFTSAAYRSACIGRFYVPAAQS